MTIRIRFFASLREKLEHSELEFGVKKDAEPGNLESISVAKLRYQLAQRGTEWQVLLETDVHVAVNQQMVDEGYIVQEGDEVAFFPPVTGG